MSARVLRPSCAIIIPFRTCNNIAWHHRTLNASDWLQHRHMQPFSERDGFRQGYFGGFIGLTQTMGDG